LLGCLGCAALIALALGTGPVASGETGRAGGLELARAEVDAAAGDGRGGVRLKRLGGFSSPTYVHGPRGAKGIVFVTEQEGKIKVIRDGKKRGTFLNISSKVSCCGERGLLSVAFPGNYRKKGRFYVYFTDNSGDLRIQEYKRRKGSNTRARRGSARNVLRIPHREFSNHNGGQLQFGPDGLLYIATGDGGGGGDPSGNAQRKTSLLGKLLRINPRPGNGRAYRTPKDNPFAGEKGRNEIYARGLRNPYRFSFDRAKRRIIIGDVGQASREEVDFEKVGGARRANFGWNAFEGTTKFPGGAAAPSRHDRPIHEYGHGGGRCSIIGGYVVRDKRLASLKGRYVYGDFCDGKIRSLIPSLGKARKDRTSGLSVSGLSTFGEDTKARIYVASLTSGTVWRLEPS
ncbi:MAG: PQQ-dependent sugar dehydrogenase, partial [Solirubrobacterales bacterium]